MCVSEGVADNASVLCNEVSSNGGVGAGCWVKCAWACIGLMRCVINHMKIADGVHRVRLEFNVDLSKAL